MRPALRPASGARRTRAIQLVCACVLAIGWTTASAGPSPDGLRMRPASGVPAAPSGPAGPSGQPGSAGSTAHGGFVDDMDCSACHTSDSWQLAQGAGASGFDHDRTGFLLRGAHVQARCTGCHNARSGGARPSASCDSCHRDPHRGRNDGTCAECHAATAWSDTRTLEQHRRTRMPLTGRHALIDCTACHRRSGERATSDVPADCYACHRTEYHAITVHPIHDGSDGTPPFSRDCGQCHRTSAWQPAIANPGALLSTVARVAEHDARFVLTTGSHRAVACSACHADPRRTRLVRCDGCHADTALRAQHRVPVSRAAAACLGCHPRGAAR
ncbi:MAG TPA: cytochrome c3 family protein [Kofleriaceae bacterium]|nr:cytochrome c3 family protein [Kofleriaceae bacterium]